MQSSIERLGPSGRGPLMAAALIVLAFAVGLVRPWDWFGLGTDSALPSFGATSSAVAALDTPGTGTPAPPTASPVPAMDAAAAKTCDYPQSWRSATIQDWAGRRARVWTAVDAVEASGPLDSAIIFTTVAGSAFTAIGWCAPVDGPQRPPADAIGTLYRIVAGKALETPAQLLEPDAPNALAELLGPVGTAGSSASHAAAGGAAAPDRSPGGSAEAVSSPPEPGPAWAPGRYVIGLTTPDGSWSRWIGVELRAVPPPPSAAPESSTAASASPSPASPRPSGG